MIQKRWQKMKLKKLSAKNNFQKLASRELCFRFLAAKLKQKLGYQKIVKNSSLGTVNKSFLDFEKFY